MQKYNPLRKEAAVVILVLFIGMSIIPSTVGVDKSSMSTFDDPTIVSILPSSQAVEPGETFEVSVYVEPGEPINGVGIAYIYYNAAIIHANSPVTFDGFFAPHSTLNSQTLGLLQIDNVNGEIRTVFEGIIGAGNVSSEGSWITISFTAQQQLGISQLNIEGVEVIDTAGGHTPVTVNDGEVTVIPSPCKLTIIVIGEGTTDPPPGVHYYPYTTPITLTAFPYTCWEFVEWSIDGGLSINNPEFFTLIDDTVVIATFTQIDYDLTMSMVGSGTITPASGVHTYACGTDVQLTATPAPGWSFAGWSGDINTMDNPTSVYLDNNKFITANFNYTSSTEIADVTLITTDPLDTIIGWENFTCTVTDSEGVTEVKVVLVGDITTEYPMTHTGGDNYYLNITISTGNEYIYYIWADNTIGNESTSLPQSFDLPMNEDVDMDGSVGFVDVMSVAGTWGQIGPDGWIRADVNNDGSVGFVDIMSVAGMWGQEW